MSIWGHHPVFVGIDMQVGILCGIAGARQAETDVALARMYDRVATLQACARALSIPVIHIRHDGDAGHRLDPSGSGWPIDSRVQPAPGESIVTKRHCDAFSGTNLSVVLENLGARTLIIVGCMTQYCIDTSCRRAISLGYDVLLVSDAHMNGGSPPLTFQQVIEHHNRTLDGLDAEGAILTLRTSEQLLRG